MNVCFEKIKNNYSFFVNVEETDTKATMGIRIHLVVC
jgi:hypothetical protein